MKTYTDKQQREIFHFLFLERLLKLSDPSLYVLKGGVNLRFFFRSPRYSEDMDLDVLGGSVATLRKNGYRILEDSSFVHTLGAFGIEGLKLSDPAKAKHSETTQRFKLRLITRAGEEFPTKIEFSRRDKTVRKSYTREAISPAIAHPYQRLSFSCQHYEGGAAVEQKLQALANRKEPQVRDPFDLYTLYLGGYVPKPFKPSLTREEIEKAAEHLTSFSFNDYRDQVVEYVDPDAARDFRTRKHWESVQETVLRLLLEEG